MKHTIYITRSPRNFLYPMVPALREEIVFNPDLQVFDPNKECPSEFLCWSHVFIDSLGKAIEDGLVNHEDWTINAEGKECKFDSEGMLTGFPCGWFSSLSLSNPYNVKK